MSHAISVRHSQARSFSGREPTKDLYFYCATLHAAHFGRIGKTYTMEVDESRPSWSTWEHVAISGRLLDNGLN